jgi:NADH-quinone oxidoreductase subunit L
MLLASTMAMVDRDIKKVWAYSTISQLGFMIMAMASGGTAGFFAGTFHLTTHAAFKALLFLCAGVFIHTYGTNDIHELGQLGCRRLKIPAICILVAAGALAGLPPLSGFFSKEAVLAALANLSNPIWLAAGLLGVFLTAYYAFRVIFVVLSPPAGAGKPDQHSSSSGPLHDAGHQGAPYWVMAWPLMGLAVITLVSGFFGNSLHYFLVGEPVAEGAHAGGVLAWLPYVALALAAGGVGLAWMEFGRRGARQVGFVERIPILHTLFAERWYLDHFYRLLVDRIIDKGISLLFFQNDNKVIDGSIDGMCKGTVAGGRIIAFLHLGSIQYWLLVVFAVMVLLAFYFFL